MVPFLLYSNSYLPARRQPGVDSGQDLEPWFLVAAEHVLVLGQLFVLPDPLVKV
jgi:hypothetical protein